MNSDGRQEGISTIDRSFRWFINGIQTMHHTIYTYLLLGFLFGAVPAMAQDSLSVEMENLQHMEKSRYISFMQLLQKSPGIPRPFSVAYYKLNLSFVKPGISGSVTVIAKSLQNSVSQISLDLADALTVDSILIDGRRTSFSHTSNLLNISCLRNYDSGETFTVLIYYYGTPAISGFGSFGDAARSDGARWIWTLSEPYGASDWWPCINHPSSKADSVDIWITCLNTYKAVSQGKLIEALSNGDGTTTYKWKHRYKIASYLISITLTNFNVLFFWYKYSPTDSMEIVNYVTAALDTLYPGFQTNIALTPRMLEIYSGLFGQYPFIKEKYGHAEFGWGGGMEHQTITSLGTYAFSESTIAHELAHQWFGDMITCQSWPDLWLNEGFATYCEALYREKQYGYPSYISRMNGYASSAKFSGGTLVVQDTANVSNLFNGSRVYNKGAWVLHMLRHVLGDSTFFRAMRSYANDPQFMYSTASTRDFQAVCERVSGNNLSAFFNEWVYGERYPKYYCSVSVAPQGQNYLSTIRIQQITGTSNPAYFTMPLDLRFFGPGLDTTFQVINNLGDQSFTCATRLRPDSIQFDPQNWILKDYQQVPTGVDMVTQIPRSSVLYQNYPNPFNPTTEIDFQITTAGFVTLKVYDVLGRKVAALLGEKLEPGYYSRQWNASAVPSGVYFYRLSVEPSVRTTISTSNQIGHLDEILETRKMVLMK
jgi:aminopeptidase N